MPNPTLLPLTRSAGAEPSELTSANALDGTAGWLDVIGLQSGTGLVSGVLGIDAAIAGSDFIWNKEYLPTGRSLYLETYASGSVLTTQITAQLYTAAGVAVANAITTTTNTTTGALIRSAAFTLTDNTAYQLHLKATILGTASLKLARLIIL